jgi:NTE family protein
MKAASHRLVSAAAVLFCLIVRPVVAQDVPEHHEEEAADARLRVGLVLGGGGARGAAHIGVLKELERLQIPIDAIAGTSMGAVVGGLYATGMSADDLERLVGSLDWAAALSDDPDREDLSFRRKQDDSQAPIDFELGIRGTELVLPKGAIQGQELDLLLRELTLGVSQIRNFDDLPIPFRAIASDIERGEIWVMDSGDLAQSIRASMSGFPGSLRLCVLTVACSLTVASLATWVSMSCRRWAWTSSLQSTSNSHSTAPTSWTRR